MQCEKKKKIMYSGKSTKIFRIFVLLALECLVSHFLFLFFFFFYFFFFFCEGGRRAPLVIKCTVVEKMTEKTDSVPSQDMVSLSALESIKHYVLELREKLQGVFKQDRPRLEVAILSFVEDIYSSKLRPYLEMKSMAKNRGSGVSAVEPVDQQVMVEGRYIVENVLQDILASLLFLLSEASLYPSEMEEQISIDVSSPPSVDLFRRLAKSNQSDYYVSLPQRTLCGEFFFYLCFNAFIPLENIFQSLYPLLSRAPRSSLRSTNEGHEESLENHICENLLSNARFSWIKKLLSEVLNGLIVSFPSSIQQLYKVFVLSDRLSLGTSVNEAAEALHQALVTDMGTVWKRQKDEAVLVTRVVRTRLSFEDQCQAICLQLIDLFTKRKCESIDAVPKETPADVGFKETIEDRLHLALILLLNQLLFLPCKADTQYRKSYERLFYTNRYFLTAAFSALSLRKMGPIHESALSQCLLRVYTLVHGVELGASPLSLTIVLEVIMPGLLSLGSIHSDLSKPLQQQLDDVWYLLHQEHVVAETVAELAIRSCFGETTKRFVVGDRVEKVLLREEYSPCWDWLFEGLAHCILSFTLLTASDGSTQCSLLLHKTLHGLVRHCHTLSLSPDTPQRQAALPSALSTLEDFLASAPANVIFGFQSTLHQVFEFFNELIVLSPACFEWVVRLSEKIVQHGDGKSVDGSHSGLELPKTVEENKALLSQLTKFIRLLPLFQPSGDMHPANGERILTIAVLQEQCREIIRKCEVAVEALSSKPTGYSSAAQETITTLSELHQVILRAEEQGSVAQLSIALSQLSRMVEDLCVGVLQCPVEEIEKKMRSPMGESLITALFRVLQRTSDTFCAVSAIKILCWIGMYRWDSADASVLGRRLWEFLLAPPPKVPSCPVLANKHSSILSEAEQLGMIKARLLDLLLSWCDYDHQGQTLRLIDDYGKRCHSCNLFELIGLLCRGDQPEVVQVAALHFLGNFFPSVYPRVSLWQLTQLCQDVFRHTPIQMAKAACSAMLVQIVQTITSQSTLQSIFEQDKELSEIKTIANAMAHYFPPPPSSEPKKTSLNAPSSSEPAVAAVCSFDDHCALIRQHGNTVLTLLTQFCPPVNVVPS